MGGLLKAAVALSRKCDEMVGVGNMQGASGNSHI